MLHHRPPSHAARGESEIIELTSNVEAITFTTDDKDGFNGFMKVIIAGENQLYHCIDCLEDSPTTVLHRLYLDKDGNGPHDLEGASNCIKTCTFTRALPEIGLTSFGVSKNNLYQKIPILTKQWKVSLDIMPTGVVDGRSNIMHVGLGGDSEVYGDRTPSISFRPGTTELTISSAISGNKNYYRTLPAIPMHQWTKVEIDQIEQTSGSFQYTIRVAGAIVHQKINTEPTEFHDVKVFTGNNYDEPAEALVDNIIIDAGGM